MVSRPLQFTLAIPLLDGTGNITILLGTFGNPDRCTDDDDNNSNDSNNNANNEDNNNATYDVLQLEISSTIALFNL